MSTTRQSGGDFSPLEDNESSQDSPQPDSDERCPSTDVQTSLLIPVVLLNQTNLFVRFPLTPNTPALASLQIRRLRASQINTFDTGVPTTRLLAAWGDSETISYHGAHIGKAEVVMFGGQEGSNVDPLLDLKSDPSVSFFDFTSVSHDEWLPHTDMHEQ